MDTTLVAPAQWAQMEFASARLGDQRRTQRLVTIAQHLARNPGGTLPQAFPEWDELKAAYRFFNQPKNSYQEILRPHLERTRARCREPGEYLLVEDTSELDYTGHALTAELGSIGNGNGRGLLLHSTLAIKVGAWDLNQRPEGVALGLFGQHCWCRRGPQRGRERWRQRLNRPRESQRWAAVLEEVSQPPAESTWVYIADREADFYEPFERCQRRGVHAIIRAYRDRKLVEPEQGYEHVKELAAHAPERGQMTVELRSRGGEPARTAILQVRACAVRVQGPWRPGGQQPDLALNVVEAHEVDVPPGIEPLRWLLLTTLPCTRWVEVRRIVARYAARWWVEEYHKALKSGAGVEASQLGAAYRIQSLIAVLAVVAVRLLNAKWLARTRPDELVTPEVFGPQALAILAAMFGLPKGGWTHQSALVCVARIGGFLARRRDGMPGWQTIWRGWHRLMWMCDGLEIVKQGRKRCG